MAGYAAEGLARLTSHSAVLRISRVRGPSLKPLQGRGQGALSPSLDLPVPVCFPGRRVTRCLLMGYKI